ncbi:endonuclease domain-containing protein [Kineococcus rubinsiae]|uniref:endonuclease domain-containing protein n=1 Tax=Kineococcus rubinsiae TaxID=2609562 RepID=UPI00143038C8|nr:hypothetical protein [Kineococcus rubinsiae]NIZ90501.1 hypothetical protein [Kineococcus rubinsiae]
MDGSRSAVVEVLSGETLDERVRLSALTSVLPPGAAFARRTAAALHGFRLLMPGELERPPPVEVVVPAGTTPLRRPGLRCRAADLDGDVQLLGGHPVTSRLRTLLDVLRHENPGLALATADLALRLGGIDRSLGHARLAMIPGERGVAGARRLLDLADAGAESPGESWLRLRIADAGFGPVQTQIRVPRPGGAPYRLDLGWPGRRLAVEYDGRESHEGEQHRAHDARRREKLARLGWTVLAVGAGEVLGPSLALERGLGELLGLEPQLRHRTW